MVHPDAPTRRRTQLVLEASRHTADADLVVGIARGGLQQCHREAGAGHRVPEELLDIGPADDRNLELAASRGANSSREPHKGGLKNGPEVCGGSGKERCLTPRDSCDPERARTPPVPVDGRLVEEWAVFLRAPLGLRTKFVEAALSRRASTGHKQRARLRRRGMLGL